MKNQKKNNMKVKITINLSEELVQEIDSMAEKYGSRSTIIEKAIRTFLDAEYRKARDSRDLEILNKYADELNAEAMDVLTYQDNL